MNESDIPIDIHTNKLLDWLISRRHVPKDWSKKVVQVREKINEAIKDMPEDKAITDLLSGSHINYYHCKKLIDILKQTEAKSKNLFGQYNSKRMKDWVEIVKLYERDNIYLGEVASILQRNVNYEVPALKKQIAKTVSVINEYNKKESNYDKSAENLLKDFNATCKSLGIKGKKIKQELIEKASEFPQMCDKVVQEIKNLKTATTFYQDFANVLLHNPKPLLEILHYVMENGNTTVYQWRYKVAPDFVEPFNLVIEDDESQSNDDTIDFGVETEVNFDEDIDWGISVTDSVENKNEFLGNNDSNGAKGEEARTILEHLDTKNSVFNDVLELEAFLKIRLYEIINEENSSKLSMLPDSLQLYDRETLNQMLKNTQKVKESLSNTTFLHYLNIMTNQKYLNQLTEKIKEKLNSREKMLASKESIKLQRAEAVKEGESIKPKVEVLVKKSKELQGLIEDDISNRYNGRPVNLIAGANLL